MGREQMGSIGCTFPASNCAPPSVSVSPDENAHDRIRELGKSRRVTSQSTTTSILCLRITTQWGGEGTDRCKRSICVEKQQLKIVVYGPKAKANWEASCCILLRDKRIVSGSEA
jgi:hypothetical protein